ncbi:SET domain-containing protein 3, partial [Coemansia sp. RSA 2320]
MTDDEMSRSAPVYRGFARDNRGQIGLFAREPLAQGRYVCEYRGQVLLKAAYKEDPKNYYELLRTTRPHSHFHPEIDLCVDARRQGSEARFVRRSCDANVALKSIYVPGSPDSLIHLGLFATRDVLADEELTVGWEWDEGELPAVARMQPADASDYLDRPEGRRMSKVWRQAFGGITCACADTQCSVRRLFAMHGVEETAARPDAIGAGIKRRASRPHRIDTGGSGGGSDPQLSSPDGAKEARASHSRKGSVAGAGATNGDSDANGHGRGALGSTQQVGVYGDCNGEGDGGGSSDDSSRAANRRGASSSSSSNKSRSRSQSRKRKPSGPSAEPAVRATSPVASSDGCRKQRSASGTPVPWKASSPPPCSLPLKKLWMSQYLELTESRADNQGALVAPAASMGIGTPMDTGDVTMADVGTNAEASPVAHVDANAEAKPMAEHTATPLSGLSEPPKSDGVAGSEAPVAADQSVVRSLPTDADAPTPSPTGASLSAPADVDEAPEALSASSLGQASEGPTDSPVACAISEGVPPSVAPAAPKPAAAKKQRLSLEEYNKRRRGNTATPTGADIDADGEGAAPRPAADEPTHAAPMPGRALQSASPATLGSAPSISDGAVQSAAPATPISAPPVLAPVAVGPRPPLTGSSLERDHRRRDASRERESGEIARTYRPP